MHKEFFEQLHEEHEEVMDILNKMIETAISAKKSRQDMLSLLETSLRPHMKAEEDLFYPLLSNRKETHDAALEALEEHHAAEIILNELSELRVDADNWKAKAVLLKELIEHHISEEEGVIFELVRKNLSESATDDIFYRFLDEEEHMRQLVSS